MPMLLENNVLIRLQQVNVITGLVLLVIGLLLAFLATKITKAYRKIEKIDTSDRFFLAIKAAALALILASLILMVVK